MGTRKPLYAQGQGQDTEREQGCITDVRRLTMLSVGHPLFLYSISATLPLTEARRADRTL